MSDFVRPNIVLIMVDTQRADAVSCYGQPGVLTPNIDRVAAGGWRFDRAYCASPVCTAARGALFTGVHPARNGAWANGLPLYGHTRHMGQWFGRGGYATCYTGKWHLDGHDYFGDGICPDGWNDRYWYDGRRYLEDIGPEQAALWRGGFKNAKGFQGHAITSEWTWAHRVGDRAIEFLRHHDAFRTGGRRQPFLLVVSFDEPHGPSVCPPEDVERFRGYRHPVGPAVHDDLADKPAHHRAWADECNIRHRDETVASPRYFGCNHFVDRQIGRVLDAVERHAGGPTWIVYTSDHGSAMGEHRVSGKGPAMYEPITRVPLLIRPPQAIEPRVVPTPVSHLDLMPTLLQIAGLPVRPALDGRSLLERMRSGDGSDEDAAFLQFNRFGNVSNLYGAFAPIRAVATRRYKLVVNLLQTDELYDLDDDPHEMRNRIDDPRLADVRGALHDRLLAWMDDHGDPFRAGEWAARPWRGDAPGRSLAKERWAHPADGSMPSFLDYGTATVAADPEDERVD